MVLCASCGRENREGRKFCVGCGQSLAVELTCPSCGAPYEPDESFCGECGTALAAAPAPAAAVGPTAETAVAERRLVSVLFADLVGFTTLSASRDPEEVRELLSRYFDTCRRLVGLYGGVVEKFIGDAVMALFGAPRAHEDDPLRAARAALEIHEALSRLSESEGRLLQAHVGIASGEVVAGMLGRAEAQEYTVLGDSVNLAARLVAAAGAGQTLISDGVYRALLGRGVCDSLGQMQFKGIERAVRVWRWCRREPVKAGLAWALVTAVIGGFLGVSTALVLMILSPSIWVAVLKHETPIFPYTSPALFSMAVAFFFIWLFSVTDKSARAAIDRDGFDDQRVRSETGIGASQASDH